MEVKERLTGSHLDAMKKQQTNKGWMWPEKQSGAISNAFYKHP